MADPAVCAGVDGDVHDERAGLVPGSQNQAREAVVTAIVVAHLIGTVFGGLLVQILYERARVRAEHEAFARGFEMGRESVPSVDEIKRAIQAERRL